MTIRAALAITFCVSTLSPIIALAQEGEPQEIRQELMDEVGDANGVMGNMVRGRSDYDADAVLEALAVLEENVAAFVDYFPEGSETGYETEALPAIWEDKADFEAIAARLVEDAGDIRAAAPADLETFQPMFMAMTQSCGDCHDSYRQSDD